MAPSTSYRGGVKDVHFKTDFNRFKDYLELCHKEGKTYTQDFNDYIVWKLQRNSIAENDMPGENVACLGFTPKPVQRKITDVIDNSNKSQNPNPRGIPFYSSIRNIQDYLLSQNDPVFVDTLHSWSKIWEKRSKDRLTELKQALAYRNNPRVRVRV